MTNSELTLRKAIERLDDFNPLKILFNDVVLYNDYDSELEVELGAGVFGELDSPLEVIPNRLWQFDKYVVNSINIEVIEHHHCIVSMRGEYKQS